MNKSKTKIESQLKNKTNPELVKTIILAKKNPAWTEVASILTTSAKVTPQINLSKINATEAKIIVVPGKVLSQGEVTKKVKVAAFKFSEKAKEKLKKAGCEIISIAKEIESNKDAKDVTILK